MKEKFAALAVFLPALESGAFQCGKWSGGETREDGVMTMPWFERADDMSAFIDACYPVMMSAFRWTEWKETEEAKHVHDHVETASEDELRKLLTMLIRQERFVEGLLASACQNGLFLKVAQRAKALSEV